MSKLMKAMRAARRMSQSFCIVLLLLTCGALSARNQQHRIRNIVLVHGAWADGSGWKGVYDILESRKLRLQTTWPPPSMSLLNKMDLAFLSVIAKGEP
jgi:hypothetical protein